MSYVPDRGDVVWLTLDPQKGHGQAGRRPVLTLSPLSYNSRIGLILCCPITTQVKGYPFEVAVPEGTKLRGVILADQVKSFDWKERGADFIASVDSKTLQDVLRKFVTLVQLDLA